MFVGHAALGFAARRVAPRAPLPWLLAAPWMLDLLWPVFLLLGWERVRIAPGATRFTPLEFVSYPISHSLLLALVWSGLAAGAYAAWWRDRRGAIVIGFLVASHWLLDAIVHRADLPIAPGLPTRVGLGLWNSVFGTVAIEGALFAAGVATYASATRARGVWGHVSLWSLVFTLSGIYAANATSPPPPSAQAIAWTMIVFGVMVTAWAAWIDRTRALAAPTRTANGS